MTARSSIQISIIGAVLALSPLAVHAQAQAPVPVEFPPAAAVQPEAVTPDPAAAPAAAVPIAAAPAAVEAPASAEQAPAPAEPAATGEEAEDIPEPESEATDSSTASATLFFSANEMESILSARQQFLEGIVDVEESEADLLDQLQGIKSQQLEEVNEKAFPQFYLETLMYRSPTDWTVYLKDGETSKKFTPATEIPENARLKIIVVKPEEVIFEWKPRNWVYVSGKFTEGKGIKMDTARQMLIFGIGVNQTMSSYDMEIKEGVVTPVDIATANAAKTAPAPKRPSGPPAARPPAPQKKPAVQTPPPPANNNLPAGIGSMPPGAP